MTRRNYKQGYSHLTKLEDKSLHVLLRRNLEKKKNYATEIHQISWPYREILNQLGKFHTSQSSLIISAHRTLLCLELEASISQRASVPFVSIKQKWSSIYCHYRISPICDKCLPFIKQTASSANESIVVN